MGGATRIGEELPVIFSAADKDSGFIYWANLDDITVDDDKRQTTCSYSNLRPMK